MKTKATQDKLAQGGRMTVKEAAEVLGCNPETI
jgi:hypothetical protein